MAETRRLSCRTLVLSGGVALLAWSGLLAPAGAQTVAAGVFSVSPTSGPQGTVVTLKSVDKCDEKSPGQVVVQMSEPATRAVLATRSFPIGKKGSWSATLQVPSTASQGTKQVDASCRYSNNKVAVYNAQTFTVGPPPPGFRFSRTAGTTRYDTARLMAGAAFPGGASVAVVASGATFPDALAGTFLAGTRQAPVLLVQQGAVPQQTLDAFKARKTKTVLLLGGRNAISKAVEDKLRATTSTAAGGGKLTVTRVEGPTRYATAAAVARSGSQGGGVGTVQGKRTAIVASGTGFADALAAGPIAYRARLPVLLTPQNTLAPEAKQALTDLAVEQVIIPGGKEAVSAAVEQAIVASGITVVRVAGKNRSETSARLADYAVANVAFNVAKVNLARGDDFADALAGGPFAGVDASPVLLTESSGVLGNATRDYLRGNAGRFTAGKIFGGNFAVTPQVESGANAAASQ